MSCSPPVRSAAHLVRAPVTLGLMEPKTAPQVPLRMPTPSLAPFLHVSPSILARAAFQPERIFCIHFRLSHRLCRTFRQIRTARSLSIPGNSFAALRSIPEPPVSLHNWCWPALVSYLTTLLNLTRVGTGIRVSQTVARFNY